MTLLALPAGSRPACVDHVAEVDAAMARIGGPESKWLREELCPTCPEAAACLFIGIAKNEHGVWGGTSSKWRSTHAGATAPTHGRNVAGLFPKTKKPTHG